MKQEIETKNKYKFCLDFIILLFMQEIHGLINIIFGKINVYLTLIGIKRID